MIVVCGETLIDLVPASGAGSLWRALPGGSPANTAVALSRLSTPTAMLARISSDAFGALLRRHLSDNHVDLRYVIDATEPTTLAIVDVDEAGAARYTFHLDGTADWQWKSAELPASLPDEIVAIHAGSMALLRPPGGATLEALLARERPRRVVSVDPNVRAVMCPDHGEYARVVERWLGVAHIVKASADDISWLYPQRSLEAVLAEWAAAGPELVVATLGGDGAVAQTADGEVVAVPGESVNVVDTIGAGDTFSAGLLHALDVRQCLNAGELRQLTAAQLTAVLRFAVRVSALACTRAGADPPYAADLPDPVVE
jgi:fructokinase